MSSNAAMARAGHPVEPSIRPNPSGLDLPLCMAMGVLLTLGLVMVYSSSAAYAVRLYDNPSHFILRQLVWCSVGLMLAWGATKFSVISFLSRKSGWLMLLAILLCAAVWVDGFGVSVKGARRWLEFGVTRLQPSEFAKLAVIVFAARILSKPIPTGVKPWVYVAIIAGIIHIPSLLIVRQPDLGTMIVIEAVLLCMLIVAGLKLRYIAMLILAFLPYVYHNIMTTPFRLRRVVAWLNPWLDRLDSGYQLTESMTSIGAGGALGVGLGEGKKQLGFLPEAHTDFIFAILAEELGFVGVLVLLAAFTVVIWRSVRIAQSASNLYHAYLATGLTALIAVPAAWNMAVATGVAPTKGLPLPFISFGGTNLVMSLFAVGLLLRIGIESSSQGRDQEGEA